MIDIKGIIFDFNGVLLWDTHLHETAWLEVSKDLRGVAFTRQEMDELMHGRPNKAIFEYLLGAEIALDRLKELERNKENIYQNLCVHEIKQGKITLSPGAEELLDLIVENAIPHTIATGSPEMNLNFYIQHFQLQRWFDVSKIVYDNGTLRGKPFPDVYLKAAENIGLLPRQCMVIEDAISGIAAAKFAGIGKIFAIGPQAKHKELKAINGVDGVIETLAEISGIIC